MFDSHHGRHKFLFPKGPHQRLGQPTLLGSGTVHSPPSFVEAKNDGALHLPLCILMACTRTTFRTFQFFLCFVTSYFRIHKAPLTFANAEFNWTTGIWCFQFLVPYWLIKEAGVSSKLRNVPTEEGSGLIFQVQKFGGSCGHTVICGNVSSGLCWCLFV